MSQFNFNDVIEWGALNETEREEILRRPAVMAGDRIKTVVEGILEAVRERGDEALREFSAKFDRTEVKDFRVSAEEVDAAELIAAQSAILGLHGRSEDGRRQHREVPQRRSA